MHSHRKIPGDKVTPSDYDKFFRKLQAAIDHAKTICVIGPSNTIESIQKTNAWSTPQRFFYNVSGSYAKFPDVNAFSYYELMANSKFNPATETLVCYTEHAVYNSLTDTTANKKIEWFYRPDPIEDIENPQLNIACINGHLNPLEDPLFQLDPSHKYILALALLSMVKRQGNCGVLALLVGKYLWENPEGIISIHSVVTAKFDHQFDIVNLCGDPVKPETWTDGWIIDAWYQNGIIYHVSQFNEKIVEIQKFAEDQIEYRKKMGLKFDPYKPTDTIIQFLNWQIWPQKNKYPSYSPRLQIQDYYVVVNNYPKIFHGNLLHNIRDYLRKHKKRFWMCLEQIKMPELRGIPSNNPLQEQDPVSQASKGLYSVVCESLEEFTVYNSFHHRIQTRLTFSPDDTLIKLAALEGNSRVVNFLLPYFDERPVFIFPDDYRNKYYFQDLDLANFENLRIYTRNVSRWCKESAPQAQIVEIFLNNPTVDLDKQIKLLKSLKFDEDLYYRYSLLSFFAWASFNNKIELFSNHYFCQFLTYYPDEIPNILKIASVFNCKEFILQFPLPINKETREEILENLAVCHHENLLREFMHPPDLAEPLNNSLDDLPNPIKQCIDENSHPIELPQSNLANPPQPSVDETKKHDSTDYSEIKRKGIFSRPKIFNRHKKNIDQSLTQQNPRKKTMCSVM